MSDKELWHFVCDVGKRLKRPADDLEPYYNTLLDNWYDTIDGLAGAAAEELASVGIPLRFAKELVVAAQAAESKGRHEGSGKSHSKDSKDKDRGKGGGGKSKGKGKSDHKSSRDELEHILELEGGLDPGFDLKRHLIGERGRNVHHIQDQTGCSVMVEGGGSEPPSIVIRGPSEAALKKAVEQATDLSNAVYGQYQEWLDEQYGRSKGGKESSKGKGKGKHKGKDGKDKDKHKESSKGGGGKGGDYKQVVECWDADPGFRLKGKIIGENGRNLHHVQDQSGAQVWVKGSDNEIPYLEITAPSHHALQEAVDLCSDLLNVVKEEYEEWQRGSGGGGGGSEGGKGKGKHKGKDKDKGKGKGKWRNRDGDEDPPAKRARHY